jgi:hypothetical protein
METQKSDKVVELFLYSPHVCDFVFQREDQSYYLHRKDGEVSYYELTKGETGWVIGKQL